MQANVRQRFDSLQLLRGLAATIVAGFHLNAVAIMDPKYAGVFKIFRKGEIGVDFFFVLSGFIIYFTASNYKKMTASRFIEARFFRVYPPYFVILAFNLLAIIAYTVFTGAAPKDITVRSLLVSIFLLPYPDHLIATAWTLSIEMVFYLVFALTYFRFGKVRFFVAMLIWVALSQILKVQNFFDPHDLSFLLHSAVLEFLMGALIAEALLSNRTQWRFPSLFFGIILLIVSLSGFAGISEWSREFAIGIPAAFIIYGLTAWQVRLPRALTLWGDASYILYLAHLIIFSVLARALGKFFPGSAYAHDWEMFIMLFGAVFLSCAASLWLEKPYQMWYRKRLEFVRDA